MSASAIYRGAPIIDHRRTWLLPHSRSLHSWFALIPRSLNTASAALKSRSDKNRFAMSAQ